MLLCVVVSFFFVLMLLWWFEHVFVFLKPTVFLGKTIPNAGKNVFGKVKTTPKCCSEIPRLFVFGLLQFWLGKP